jgi:Putative beta barrel porin-7 (BBP7)
MRKEMLCVLGVLLVGCGVQAQQWPASYDASTYYQGQIQPVQMAPGAGNGGYGPYYYPNNYGYVPSYPPNYGYGANGGYGMNYGYEAGVPNGGIQVPSDLPATPSEVSNGPVADTGAIPPTSGGGQGCPNKLFWVSADYLQSSIQRGPLTFPLVTVGSNRDPIPGALGQPNTSVVFGTNNLDNRFSHGIQGEAGMFLDPDRMFSLDVKGFYLFPDKNTSVFASDGMGFPVIARPYINTVGGQLRAEQSALPPLFSGSTTVDSETKLYGFETNARINGRLASHWDADFLGGFRLVRLEERLTISDRLNPIPGGVNGITFLGQPVDPLASLADQDSFSTTNTFYGLNLGGRLRWQYDWFFVSAFAKVALGATEERVRIAGSTTLLAPTGTQTAVGGILALPSNIGTYNRSVFGVVPETGVTFGVQPIQHLRLTAGYSFLYWNAVARPGDQIDPRLNRTQIPGDSTFGQPGGAGSNPAFSFQDRTFRVHNLTAGIEIYY